jgi:coenzyme F420 biosynthesis associated uncharacterized protein
LPPRVLPARTTYRGTHDEGSGAAETAQEEHRPVSGTGWAAGGMVDWDLAVATGSRLVRPGPAVSREEAQRVVAGLRRFAEQAQGHVREVTGLVAHTEGPAVAVIDRPGWIRANADGFRVLLTPVLTRLEAKRRDVPVSGLVQAFGSRVTAVETGSLLAFMATKVLGQYELFSPYGEHPDSGSASTSIPGRLLLVAPNIVSVEQELGVEPRDFRLWVCVHEETHRVQFTAVPWLREWVLEQLQAFLAETDLDVGAILSRLRAAAGAVSDAVRGEDGEGGSLVEAVQTPAQREILDRITAVMSLLEGHADHVMDAVGPEVIPSVATIRAKFQKRRESGSRFDQVVRRLLGLDAKMRQYRDGERFVRAVVEAVGMDGFNRVWTSPQTLPTRSEISDPDDWMARVVPAPSGT